MVSHVIITWSDTSSIPHQYPISLPQFIISLSPAATSTTTHSFTIPTELPSSKIKNHKLKTLLWLSPQGLLPIFDFWGPLHPRFFKFWARGLSPLLRRSRRFTTSLLHYTYRTTFFQYSKFPKFWALLSHFSKLYHRGLSPLSNLTNTYSLLPHWIQPALWLNSIPTLCYSAT